MHWQFRGDFLCHITKVLWSALNLVPTVATQQIVTHEFRYLQKVFKLQPNPC